MKKITKSKISALEMLERRPCLHEMNHVAYMVHANSKNKGFHEEPFDSWWPKMLLNSVGEIIEAWDADRAGQLHAPCDKAKKMKAMGLRPLTCGEEEYADRIIRALDECSRLEYNVAEIVLIKHLYNTTRAYKHGKKH